MVLTYTFAFILTRTFLLADHVYDVVCKRPSPGASIFTDGPELHGSYPTGERFAVDDGGSYALVDGTSSVTGIYIWFSRCFPPSLSRAAYQIRLPNPR